MAATKISAMTVASYLGGTEELPIADGSGSNLAALVSQIHAGALIYQNADYTLTSATSAQKLFNQSTNGALTVGATGLYEFEAQLALNTMSATSGNGAFSLAGTATLAGQLMLSAGADVTLGTLNQLSGAAIQGASTFTTNTVSAGTAAAMSVHVRGILKVTATGTIIPSIALTTAAAAVVKAGSWFRLKMVAPASVYTVGNWS